jgi:hypothetical protein
VPEGVAVDESIGDSGEGGVMLQSKSARHERGKEDERESRIHAVRAMVCEGNWAWVRYRMMVGTDGREGEVDCGIRLAR